MRRIFAAACLVVPACIQGSPGEVGAFTTATTAQSDSGENHTTGSESEEATGSEDAPEEGTDGEAGDESGEAGDESGEDGGTEGPGPIFDVGAQVDVPQCVGGDTVEFSHIWVANSEQHTLSKIDTQALEEVGRYLTRPDGSGDPSRTSVSPRGDVAVANRMGGITKVFARESDCQESNGVPGIQTSTDGTFLAWDEEECRAWHTPFDYASQRPVAWTKGEFNPDSCEYEDAKLWTSGTNGESIDVLLLNAEDGSVEDSVNLGDAVPMLPAPVGMYGAAVDGEGNLWGNQSGAGKLMFVDRDDLTFKTWDTPGWAYGITVDPQGYVWTCANTISRFDPADETWMSVKGHWLGGCVVDEDGILWTGRTGGAAGYDTETLELARILELDEDAAPRGVSIDFFGYLWAVSMPDDKAYRIDLETEEYQSVTGLVGPYTYSDMTGFALFSAGVP